MTITRPPRGSTVLLLDVGSTFTKAALVDAETGRLVATAEVPTTSADDVMHGVAAVRAAVGATSYDPVLACSSAGGGLRIAVVGYETDVTAEAGRRVGLSAGGRVVHVAAGPLDRAAVSDLRVTAPDLVLLVGGTDGGNSEVLRHNAARLAGARLAVPIVVAGNVEAREEVAAVLAAAGRQVVCADNVVPRIGVIEPASARAAIRQAFLEHVIGGKGLSRDPAFTAMMRAATPDAVLAGVQVVAEQAGGDVLVVDVGGATTDVYSSVTPVGEDAALRKEVVAPLPQARTVEGDLGMRWSADGVLEAAERERLPVGSDLSSYVAGLTGRPSSLPETEAERRLDLTLARVAAVVAVRRHARPAAPGHEPRPLGDVGLVVGSGGALRHADAASGHEILKAVLEDHAGGWKVPRAAQVIVDSSYRLFAVGLLAPEHPRLAQALARELVGA